MRPAPRWRDKYVFLREFDRLENLYEVETMALDFERKKGIATHPYFLDPE